MKKAISLLFSSIIFLLLSVSPTFADSTCDATITPTTLTLDQPNTLNVTFTQHGYESIGAGLVDETDSSVLTDFLDNTDNPVLSDPSGTVTVLAVYNQGNDSPGTAGEWLFFNPYIPSQSSDHTNFLDGNTYNFTTIVNPSSSQVSVGDHKTYEVFTEDNGNSSAPVTCGNTEFSFVTPSSIKIEASPSSNNVSVGTPFNVDINVNSASDSAFNAAQATVAVSSNLSITGIHNPTSNACNLQYTKHPTPSNPSFAGAIFGGSSTGCTLYTMTLTPTATGTGTITFTNGSIKAYSDNSEILTGVQNGSFTIGDGPTPTPTSGVPQLTITSPLETYYLDNSYTLVGGKDTSITHVFVNGSETGVTLPTSTTWQVSETLAALGTGNTPSDNYFTIYGSDGTSNTASQTVDVSRHALGDINGDGVVDLTDASLFAVDWGKTSNLTYVLSDMNGDGSADLTDLSILAKLED